MNICPHRFHCCSVIVIIYTLSLVFCNFTEQDTDNYTPKCELSILVLLCSTIDVNILQAPFVLCIVNDCLCNVEIILTCPMS